VSLIKKERENMSDYDDRLMMLEKYEKQRSKDNSIKTILLIIGFIELCIILYVFLISEKSIEKVILPSLIIGGIISLISSLTYYILHDKIFRHY